MFKKREIIEIIFNGGITSLNHSLITYLFSKLENYFSDPYNNSLLN